MRIVHLRAQVAALWLAWVLARFVSVYWFPALVALLAWVAWLIASAMGYIV